MQLLKLISHSVIAVFVYFILFIFLKEDLRVPTTESSRVLNALGINASIFRYRALRYNSYIINEPKRTGFGELGRGVHLNLAEHEMNDLINQYAYNIKACSKIALDRSLGNIPAAECLAVSYPINLPSTSVIIIFYNEPFRLIIRTAFSVVNRSPPKLLKEIILVDDGSTQADLLEPMDKFIKENWPDGVVRVVRSSSRQGLIRARVAGARVATGDVLIFLDAHCEATSRWLEPLLARIHEQPKTVVCPAIANIDKFTLTFFRSDVRYTDDGYLSLRVGSFAWDGMFVFEHPPKESIVNRANQADPIKSLTMAGGLFAMRRDFFFELGLYDEGMEVWGGENLEISFRIWQCSGTLEVSPCSTVGHVYRSNHPYKMPDGKDFYGYNTVRMAEVWMDEYKQNLYLAHENFKSIDYGELSSRQNLRKDLNCKSFQWFMDNIAPHKFVYTKNNIGYGSVCTPSGKCLYRPDESLEYRKLTMSLELIVRTDLSFWAKLFALTPSGLVRKDWACLRSRRQQTYLTWSSYIVDLETCPELDERVEQWWREWFARQQERMAELQRDKPNSGWGVVQTTHLYPDANFRWAYDQVHGKLINAETGLCLDANDGVAPVPKKCQDDVESQNWQFTFQEHNKKEL